MKQLLVFGCNYKPYLTSLNLCHCLISNLYLKKPPWNCLCSKGNLYICTSPLFCRPKKSYLVLISKNFKSSSTFQQTVKGFYPPPTNTRGHHHFFCNVDPLWELKSSVQGFPPDLYGIHQRHCWSFDGKKYGQNHRRLLELELQIPAKPQMNDIHQTLFVCKSWGFDWINWLPPIWCRIFVHQRLFYRKNSQHPTSDPVILPVFGVGRDCHSYTTSVALIRFLVTTSTIVAWHMNLSFPIAAEASSDFRIRIRISSEIIFNPVIPSYHLWTEPGLCNLKKQKIRHKSRH